MTAWTLDETKLFLEQAQVLEGVPTEARGQLAGKAKVQSYPASAVIVQRGESGDSLFLVASGQVRVTLDMPRGTEEVSLLKEGEFFGEIGMMTRAHRTATVAAVVDSTVVELDAEDVMSLIDRYPEFKARIARTGARRSTESLEKMIEE